MKTTSFLLRASGKLEAAPISRGERARFREALLNLDKAFASPATSSSSSLIHYSDNRVSKIVAALEKAGWKVTGSENGTCRLLKDGKWPISVYLFDKETHVNLSGDDTKFFGNDNSEITPAILKLAKKILPAGYTTFESSASWRKRGGHAGSNALTTVIKRAEALGFKSASHNSDISQTDNNTGGVETYTHPDGWQLDVHSSYGRTAADNSFSADLRYNPQRGK